MSSFIYIKTYNEPPFDEREIARYSGISHTDEQSQELIRQCILKCREDISYKVCYAEYGIKRIGETVDLGFTVLQASELGGRLDNCQGAILFVATVGHKLDRIISRYSRTSAARAVILQAIGAERTEALCDLFCRDMENEYRSRGYSLTHRFSPGYGSLPLSMQEEIFAALKPEVKIGVSLTDSLLMSPTKSVSAIIGIKDKE